MFKQLFSSPNYKKIVLTEIIVGALFGLVVNAYNDGTGIGGVLYAGTIIFFFDILLFCINFLYAKDVFTNKGSSEKYVSAFIGGFGMTFQVVFFGTLLMYLLSATPLNNFLVNIFQ